MPVEIALPPGLALRRIHGGPPEPPLPAAPGLIRPEVSPGFDRSPSGFDVTLVIDVDPTNPRPEPSNRTLCASPQTWSGWLLLSENSDVQNIWVPTFTCWTRNDRLTPVLDFPLAPASGTGRASATISLTLSGYSLNIDREVPTPLDGFLPGVVSDDLGLGAVLAATSGKDLRDPDNRETMQDVIWDYTDFGGLTQPNLSRLAELR